MTKASETARSAAYGAVDGLIGTELAAGGLVIQAIDSHGERRSIVKIDADGTIHVEGERHWHETKPRLGSDEAA